MTTETPAPPPTPRCATAPFCEDGYHPSDPSALTEPFASGTTADLAGPPLSPELMQEIHASVAQAVPADLDAMLGATTDPTPVIVGVLVVLVVILAAAAVWVRRHHAAVTEGDVPL